MHKKLYVILSSLVFYSFCTFTLLLLIACSNEGDLIKRSIIAQLSASSNVNITIDLNQFSNEKITKLCVQNTYMTESEFSKTAGKKINNFTEIDDNDYHFFLWVFYKNKAPIKIKFHKGKELQVSNKTEVCTLSSSIILINSKLSIKPPER